MGKKKTLPPILHYANFKEVKKISYFGMIERKKLTKGSFSGFSSL